MQIVLTQLLDIVLVGNVPEDDVHRPLEVHSNLGVRLDHMVRGALVTYVEDPLVLGRVIPELQEQLIEVLLAAVSSHAILPWLGMR